MKKIIGLLLFTFSIYSCNAPKKYDYYIHDDRVEAGVISLNKIQRSSAIKIKFDTLGNALWKRTEEIKYFDDRGLCVLEIKPKYKRKYPPQLKDKPRSIADIIGEETFIYNSYSDSTFFEYDSAFRLTKRIYLFTDSSDSFKSTTEITYDNYGNETSYCVTSEIAPINCQYSEYSYDENNRIVSRKDSSQSNGNQFGRTYTSNFSYSYDQHGNLISDGNYRYVLDSSNNLITTIPIRDGYNGSHYKYDRKRRVVETSDIYFNYVSKKTQESDNIMRFKFDQRGLLIEASSYVNDKIESLLRYTYQ